MIHMHLHTISYRSGTISLQEILDIIQHIISSEISTGPNFQNFIRKSNQKLTPSSIERIIHFVFQKVRQYNHIHIMKKLLLLFISVFSLVACWSTSDNISVNTEISNPRSIIAIGDSLTIGLGLPTGDNYPSQLEWKLRELGYNYTIENAWISGDTSAWLLSRIDWILDGANPDFVILCIGANDAFQWKSVADIEKNIRAIIEKIQSKNIRLVFAGMKAPFNMGAEYRNQYDTMFPRLAKEYKLEYVPFLLEWVALNQKYNQDDRIHPNREWYTIVVSNIMEILEDSDLLKK